MTRIDRPDDPRVADYAHLGDPGWLESHDLSMAEGRFVVRRLLEGRRFPQITQTLESV